MNNSGAEPVAGNQSGYIQPMDLNETGCLMHI